MSVSVVDDRPGHRRDACSPGGADRDHASGASGTGGLPRAGRAGRGTSRPPARRETRQRDRPPFEVRVDDIELGALLDDHLHRRREPAAGVALDPGGSKRAVDRRDELARDVRVATGETVTSCPPSTSCVVSSWTTRSVPPYGRRDRARPAARPAQSGGDAWRQPSGGCHRVLTLMVSCPPGCGRGLSGSASLCPSLPPGAVSHAHIERRRPVLAHSWVERL